MEVDGKEFLRNVALEQEQEKLRKEQEKLRSLRKDSVYNEQQQTNNEIPNDDSAYLDLSLGGAQSNPEPKQARPNENIEDIMLEPEDPNKQKKKYILLGLALILVFVITILVIRVVSNTETEQEAQTVKNEDQQELMADKILNKIDSNEEFQKAKEKKNTKAQMDQLEAQQKQQGTLEVPQETVNQDSPLLIEDPAEQNEPVRDPLGLDATPEPKQIQKPQPSKNEVATKKEQVVVENKVTPKKVESTKKAPTPTKQSTGKVQGFYVQVGAFTKQPAKSLLDQISTLGYNFAVHPVNIKGTTYNKVIIGPYPTRDRAKRDLPAIKQKMNKPGAFILSF